jgi:glutaredoxin-related protein
MMGSDAQHAVFAFASLTDEDKCHFSFNTGDRTNAINFQIDAVHVASLMENLTRVIRQRDRKQFEKSITLKDRIAELEKLLQEERMDQTGQAGHPGG